MLTSPGIIRIRLIGWIRGVSEISRVISRSEKQGERDLVIRGKLYDHTSIRPIFSAGNFTVKRPRGQLLYVIHHLLLYTFSLVGSWAPALQVAWLVGWPEQGVCLVQPGREAFFLGFGWVSAEKTLVAYRNITLKSDVLRGTLTTKFKIKIKIEIKI